MRTQDLLKCIHRFAAEFYTERGQLLNISREYRKQRKKRAQKRARQRLRASRKEEGLDSLSGSSSSQSSKSKEDSEGDPASNAETEQEEEEEEEAELDSDDHGEGPSTSRNIKKKGNAKRKGRRRAELYTDMYKMFDGSAMMALGKDIISFNHRHVTNSSFSRNVGSGTHCSCTYATGASRLG